MASLFRSRSAMAKQTRKKKVVEKRVSKKISPQVERVPDAAVRLSDDDVLGLILLLLVFLVYVPVWWARYSWDDSLLITANPCVVGPLGLKEIWTTNAADICPLTITTFWVEHALWGVRPLPYHLANVVLHGASTFLLWRVLRDLRIPGAWLGAAIWAVHPVQVETVVWISETKNTLSAVFFLLTIFFFIKGQRAKNNGQGELSSWSEMLTLLCAILAMTSKSSTVILPAVLCLCAWWIEGRWRWLNLVRVLPIGLVSVLVSLLSVWTQKHQGLTEGLNQARGWPERLATAGDAVWFYLGKLLCPYPLMTIYPRWQIDSSQWLSWWPLVGALVVLVVLWCMRRSWLRGLFFTWLFFLIALFPVLGLMNMSFFIYSFVADHFQYLASMGPLVLVGVGLTRLSTIVFPENPRLQMTVYAGLLLVLGALSWDRAWAYENPKTLWADAVAKNPDCWVGYNGLGAALLAEKRADEAALLLQKALAINPNYVAARNNLGNAFLQKGEVDKAMAEYQKAVEIKPNDAEAHNNLGVAFIQKKQADKALQQYQMAVEIKPNYAAAHNNLGNTFLDMQEVDKAIEQFQKALEINPVFAEAHYNLGNAFFQKGRIGEAIEQFQKTLEINPFHGQVRNNLGLALMRAGRVDEAMMQFQGAQKANPNDPKADNNLGLVFLQKGQVSEAIEQFQRALKINPRMAEIHTNLGDALAQEGRGNEAVEQFQKAVEIDPGDARIHYNLGVALSKIGQLNEAVVQFQDALQLRPNDAQARKSLEEARAAAGQKTVPK